jgi:hypothetical protein
MCGVSDGGEGGFEIVHLIDANEAHLLVQG